MIFCTKFCTRVSLSPCDDLFETLSFYCQGLISPDMYVPTTYMFLEVGFATRWHMSACPADRVPFLPFHCTRLRTYLLTKGIFMPWGMETPTFSSESPLSFFYILCTRLELFDFAFYVQQKTLERNIRINCSAVLYVKEKKWNICKSKINKYSAYRIFTLIACDLRKLQI